MTVRRYDKVEDGIISGVVHDKAAPCMDCGCRVRVVAFRLDDVQLPEGIAFTATLLGPYVGTVALGISCGCYAKLHRQVAHIQDSMRR